MLTSKIRRRLRSLLGGGLFAAAALLSALPAALMSASAMAALATKEPTTSQGKVVNVDDGDTVTLLAGGNFQIKVRLASIDAPESDHEKQQRGRVGQPYSQNSKQFLSGLVKGRTVDASCYEADRYGRQVCDLFVDGQNVNARMVREGWAWANEASKGRYLRDKALRQVQADAKAARRGLWAGAHPVEPWEWRKACWEGGNCPN